MTSTSPVEPAKAATISDVGAMLQAYAKLVSSLQTLPVFSEDDFGYAEWLMLRLLAAEPELKAGNLAKKLGLSAQRTAQILGPMRKGGYLQASPEAGDTRQNTLAITAKGRTQLDAVDKAVMAYFEPALTARPKSLSMMRNFARSIIKQSKPQP